MTINEYLNTYNKYYKVCGTCVDTLWDNFNNHIDTWLERYGNYEIIGIHEEETYLGIIMTVLTIDTRPDWGIKI